MEQLEEVVLKGNKIKDASNIGRSMRVIKPLKVGKSQRRFFFGPILKKTYMRIGSTLAKTEIIYPKKYRCFSSNEFHIR